MTTELRIVNNMLATMGAAPLNALDEDNRDVAICRPIIEDSLETVLSEGWWFNRELIDLYADVDSGYIYTPGDALRCDPVDRDGRRYYVVQRGRRLYDNDRNTNVFEKGSKITCELIRALPLEDLPPSVQKLVDITSVIKYQQSYDGDMQKTQQLMSEYAKKLTLAKAEDIRNTKRNLLYKNTSLRSFGRIQGDRYFR